MKSIFNLFNQVCAGFLAGFGIAFVVGYIAFQGELFRQGAESLGVSFFGLSYFFGGFITSVIFWSFSKGRVSAKYLGIFGVAVIAVGTIGLGNMVTEHGAGTPTNMLINVEGMARLVSQIFFWAIPAVGVILYGYAVIEAKQDRSE